MAELEHNLSKMHVAEGENREVETFFKIMTLIATIFSFLTSFYIILIYIFYPRIRNFAFKMVFYLNIAVCFFAIAELLSLGIPDFLFSNIAKSDELCYVQSFMITWFGLSSIIWTSIIAWTLYSTVILNNTDIENKEAKYLTIGFVLPLFAALLPFITQDYGQSGPWCWFGPHEGSILRKTILEISFLYAEIWLAFIFNTIIIYKVISWLKLVGVTSDKNWVIKLRFYPFILIICWGWGTVHKIYQLIVLDSNETNIYWMIYLMVFCCSLQGAFNAFIYGFNSNVKKILKGHLCCRFYLEDEQKQSISTECRGVEMDSMQRNYYRDSLSSTFSYDHEGESVPNSFPPGFQMEDKRTSINVKEINDYVLN